MIYGKRTVLFVTVTILFVLIAAFCVSATVVSQNGISTRVEEKYRKELEKEYIAGLREFLARQGYHNSGVTFTCVTDTDGSRIYTATIHHAAIDRLAENQRQSLKLELADLPTAIEDNICHEFLVINP